MTNPLLFVAAALQMLAVGYGVLLLARRRGAAGAWSFLLGAMVSMLVWRLVIVAQVNPPPFFNPAIAIWGSTCMFAAMFLFNREVVRRERAEAERDALLASERAARSDAERAIRLKDDFLATLSHELRTPLTAVLGWCALARRKIDDRVELERALETIDRNARVQIRLVDDLIDMTRIQAGTLHLDLARVRLDVPVSAAIEAVRPAADAKHLSIEYDVPANPPVVTGDAARLQQIAANLLVNAVKFTPPSGRVRVDVGADAESARLVVADDGLGIDGSFLPHIFTRFRQAESSLTRSHGGLGLGLSIVQHLVRLHGGQVTVASDGIGTGSTFTVSLPLATQNDPASAERPGIVEVRPRSLAGIRVLVVDDEADVRSLITRMLELSGAAVLALESGAGAEEALTDFRPDVLLVDIGMPVEDGYTLIGRLRKLPPESGGRVPAVSLTAHARDEDRARAIERGFQGHLPKPIDFDLLMATIVDLAAQGPRNAPTGSE